MAKSFRERAQINRREYDENIDIERNRRRRRREEGRGGALTRRGREEDEDENSSCLSILGSLLHKMLLCCCWPISKCTKILSCLDTLVVGIFAYRTTNHLLDTLNHVHWTAVVPFLFFAAFFTCQILATIFIILAASRNIARYCLPRLVLIAGLAICSFTVIAFMIYYFTGSAKSVNEYIFKFFEYLFGEELSEVDRVEMKHQLRYYGFGLILLATLYFIYNLFAFYLTYKFKSTLNDFEAVPTEATAPQMSHNPDFSEPPKKVYPNYA